MQQTILLLILMCSSATISIAADPLKNKKDFSIGIQAGYGSGRSKVTRTETYNFANYQNKSDKSQISSEGFMGGVLLEYQHIFQNNFYYEINLNFLYSNMKGKISTNVNAGGLISTNTRMKASYGAEVHLGKAIFNEKVFPFFILGISNSKWESKTVELPYTGVGAKSKFKQGIDLGLGVDFKISNDNSIGVQITHTEYNKLSYPLKDNAEQTVAFIKDRPRINKALFRFRHLFNSPIF